MTGRFIFLMARWKRTVWSTPAKGWTGGTGRRLMKSRVLCTLVVLLTVCFVSFGRAGQTTVPDPAAAQKAREFWNREYAEGKALRDKEPSALLVDAIRGRKPGTALDLGMGQGRNAV